MHVDSIGLDVGGETCQDNHHEDAFLDEDQLAEVGPVFGSFWIVETLAHILCVR